jgi:hypothetical protein
MSTSCDRPKRAPGWSSNQRLSPVGGLDGSVPNASVLSWGARPRAEDFRQERTLQRTQLSDLVAYHIFVLNDLHGRM